MGLFIKREKFKEYMLDDQPDIDYDENAVLLSLNTVRGKVVTNCIHRKEQLLSTYLYVETDQEVNGQVMKLKLNLPKLNRTPWHIKNLKRLQAQVPVAK